MQEPISKLQEEDHQLYLLRKSSFERWKSRIGFGEALQVIIAGYTPEQAYLKEHGLDLDSVFTD